MKKFWKNLCVCSMALVSSLSLWACGKSAPEVSVDLDGDGQIAGWETIFQNADPSDREINSSAVIEEISDLAGLKAINNKTSESKIYKLVKNINCNGEAIAINLGSSVLLGNNKIIKNFKLGDCEYKATADATDTIKANVKGLFYNGIAVYDLRMFVGNQTIDINNTNAQTIISPLINVPNIENIEVRGMLNVNRKAVEGLSAINSLEVSLLSANIDSLEIERYFNNMISIRNVFVSGRIVCNESEKGALIKIGGATPYVSKNSTLYKVDTNVEIESLSSGETFIGGIAGENENMISTCNASGSIKFKYAPGNQSPLKIGGLVGSNGRNGEIKNCISNNTIEFANEIGNLSQGPNMNVGGIVGTNYGIMTYITNDAKLDIAKAYKCNIGGIAGYSEDGIITNVLCRGEINCTSINNLYVAEMVGISKCGMYSTAIITTKVTVENAAIDSKVYFGMVTIFENLEITDLYNAEYSPYFSGILIGSKNNVYMKTDLINAKNVFTYNLGLRNKFERIKHDKDGNVVLETIVDSEGNKIDVEAKETILPDIYTNLSYTEGYSFNKYTIDAENNATFDALNITYAKDPVSQGVMVPNTTNNRLSLNFFVKILGFKYGYNHTEINLNDVKENFLAFDKLKFTLSESEHLGKYFEKLSYNGELSYFDKYIDSECTFDSNDEMFSLIYSLVLSRTTDIFMPIKISKDFAVTQYKGEYIPDIPNIDNPGEIIPEGGNEPGTNTPGSDIPSENIPEDIPSSGDDENDDSNISNSVVLAQNFANNIQKIILNMFGVKPELKQLAYDSSVIDIDDIEKVVKYMWLSFGDAEYDYTFTFNVSKMLSDSELTEDNYIVYLKYKRTDKFLS